MSSDSLHLAQSSSALLGKLSEDTVEIFTHSFKRTFLRSDADVGQKGRACSFHADSSQRCSIWLWSVWASQVLPHYTHPTISLLSLNCALEKNSLPQAEAQDCPDDRIHPLAGLFKHLFIEAVIFPLETKQVQLK